MTLFPFEIEPSLLDFLSAICREVAIASDVKPCLDEIVHLLKPILDFDFILIHQQDRDDQYKIIYAKSLREEDRFDAPFKWEEVLAQIVFSNQKTVLQQPISGIDTPINSPHFLGIPISCEKEHIGTLVLIRIGKSAYSQKEVDIAEFTAQLISMLLFRKKLQQEINSLEHQRKQSIIQDDFISNITHELRNPLGCIKGYTTTLLRPDVEWAKSTQVQFLNIIDQETDRLSSLIDNLLDAARLRSGHIDLRLEMIPLEILIKDIVERTQTHHNQINIELVTYAPITPVIGDSELITQVLENIINNGIKHAPGSDIIIAITQDDDGVSISIKDFGHGIPRQYHQRIFERFFRVPGQPDCIHGSGLGLYISAQIIRAHNGKLSVNSRLGHGAEFIIYLPCHQN